MKSKDSFPTMKIIPRSGEYLPKLLKRFKRLCEKEGILREYRKHEYYESPAQKKRRKKSAALKRLEKELEREQQQKSRYPSDQQDLFDID